jgi:hypothetical protein
MNACDIQASGAIELYFYEELGASERRDVEAHLPACEECRAALDELKTIRTALAGRPAVTAPPGDDWTSLMSRIALAVAREPVRLAAASLEAFPVSAVRRRPFPAYLAMAALITLVTASIAYLASHQSGTTAGPHAAPGVARVEPSSGTGADVPGLGPATPVSPVSSPGSNKDRFDPAFAAVSEQHFERSKLVILGLASRDPQTASSSDWAYERQLAGALLDDTRLYKQAAEARGLDSLAGVMSDLELVLLQASLSDQQDATTLDRLQRLIRKRDLVSKMETTRF